MIALLWINGIAEALEVTIPIANTKSIALFKVVPSRLSAVSFVFKHTPPV
jgi:hypothetical protein